MSVSIDPEGVEIRLIHELVDFRGKSVLEVGSGDGRLTWRYAAEAGQVLALDPDEEDVKQAIEDTPADLRPKLRFQVADILQADLPEEAFDVAILSYSL